MQKHSGFGTVSTNIVPFFNKWFIKSNNNKKILPLIFQTILLKKITPFNKDPPIGSVKYSDPMPVLHVI